MDEEANPAYLALGNTEEERNMSYLQVVSSSLEEDKLKEIRRILKGNDNYTSDTFQQQINEKLALKKKRRVGRPSKIINS